MNELPKGAVEVAARAITARWSEVDGSPLRQALIALEAAAPLIRTDALLRIADLFDDLAGGEGAGIKAKTYQEAAICARLRASGSMLAVPRLSAGDTDPTGDNDARG